MVDGEPRNQQEGRYIETWLGRSVDSLVGNAAVVLRDAGQSIDTPLGRDLTSLTTIAAEDLVNTAKGIPQWRDPQVFQAEVGLRPLGSSEPFRRPEEFRVRAALREIVTVEGQEVQPVVFKEDSFAQAIGQVMREPASQAQPGKDRSEPFARQGPSPQTAPADAMSEARQAADSLIREQEKGRQERPGGPDLFHRLTGVSFGELSLTQRNLLKVASAGAVLGTTLMACGAGIDIAQPVIAASGGSEGIANAVAYGIHMAPRAQITWLGDFAGFWLDRDMATARNFAKGVAAVGALAVEERYIGLIRRPVRRLIAGRRQGRQG